MRKNCTTMFDSFPRTTAKHCRSTRPVSFAVDLCESGVRGSPGEAAVFGPRALLYPAALLHLAPPRQLQAGADTNAAECGWADDHDVHTDLHRLSRPSQPEHHLFCLLPADKRGQHPAVCHDSTSCQIELKGEHTYADLRTCSDYDQLHLPRFVCFHGNSRLSGVAKQGHQLLGYF